MSFRFLAAASACTLLSIVLPVDAGVGAAPPKLRTAGTVTQSDRVEGVKSASGRLAETDPELLARDDSANVPVFIKLDYDAIASYAGGVAGIPATSPSVTGKKLTPADVNSSKYAKYTQRQEAAFVAKLHTKVPQAQVGQSFRLVYGGITAIIPANTVEAVLAIPGVVAVQNDGLEHLLTDSSNNFIGSPTLWNQLGGQDNAGAGVLFGGLDTGVWPEHPSLAANPALPPAPTRPGGGAIGCNFGDNPLTPATDVFVCNNKLVGGYPFLDTYNAVIGGDVFPSSARDSNGHGTHTATTAAGDRVASAPILGQDRGPISGLAPGAQVIAYKVCGLEGCFQSDSAAAVEQAIEDGVDVINFSISGGTSPFNDPVELAFLDALAAGVFVAASAGNEGPGASTANHLSGWVTSVAASTQLRRWTSTLTLSAAGGASAAVLGTSIDPVGVPTGTPVVLAQNVPGYTDALCDTPAPPGTFTGKIIGCQRSPGRIAKGFNVFNGGGVGMVLYNAPGDLFPEMSDTHFVPTIHTQNGAAFLAFLAAHPDATATISPGVKGTDQGDVMSAFSSRGPAGLFIKPDITAPGVQILAGNTPVPDEVAGGQPGQYFQSIGGTSMSSPHTAGSALLLKALHPTWTPTQIRSALMTTATTNVLRQDRTTPADPFDMGAGRIDLNVAGAAGLTLDETAARFAALAGSPLTAVHLNIPSIDAPVLPGRLETVRRVTNVTNGTGRYAIETTAPAGSSIVVTPNKIDLAPGQSIDLHIVISTTAAAGVQQFGEIRLVPRTGSGQAVPRLHIPVAFVANQGNVSLMSNCVPASVRVGANGGTSVCTVTAQNNAFSNTTASFTTTVNKKLKVESATGATQNKDVVKLTGAALAGQQVGTPSIAPGALFGYIPLDAFGVTPTAVGDESIVNFNVPPFVYAGKSYSRLGVDSNGYLVVGGGTAEDNDCCNPAIPNPARPNNVLAPFWTDLDGTGAQGIRITVLTDGVNSWIAVEWQVNVFGTTSNRHFQVWIGIDGSEDITFAYDPAALPGDPNGQPLVVGAENEIGTGGATITGLPTEDLRVTSSAPTPGGSVSYTVTVRGRETGDGVVTTEMTTPLVAGVTIVSSHVNVTP